MLLTTILHGLLACAGPSVSVALPVPLQEGFGFVDLQGREVLPPLWDWAGPFTEDRACVGIKEHYGFINRLGRVVVPIRHEDALPFSEGLAAVKKNGQWGFVDLHGNVVIPLQYQDATSFSQGRAAIKQGDAWGYVDARGNVVIQPVFQSALSFHEGLAAVGVEQASGFINPFGQWVLEPRYQQLTYGFSAGLAPAKQDDHWGYIRPDGSWAIPPRFQEAWGFREGLAAVKSNDLWGWIDTQGTMVIQPVFDEAGSFREGLASAKSGELYGFVDTAGRMVIEPQFTNVGPGFLGGVANVKRVDGWNYVTPTGQPVVDRTVKGRVVLSIHVLLLVIALILAQPLAWWLTRKLRIPADGVGHVMPCVAFPAEWTAGRRSWPQRLRRLKLRVLAYCSSHPGDTDAARVAGALAENVDVVGSLLEELAMQAKARVRVTSLGRVIYNFDLEVLKRMHRAQQKHLIKRLLAPPVLLMVNISTTWPLLLITLFAALVANFLRTSPQDAWTFLAIMSVAVWLCLATLWLGGAVLGVLLAMPWMGPRRPKPISRKWHGYASVPLRWMPWYLSLPASFYLGVFLVPLDWIIQLLSTFMRPPLPPPGTAPATWTAQSTPKAQPRYLSLSVGHALEIWIAIDRLRSTVRPWDQELASRVLSLAASQQGHVSALDLQLHEGLCAQEAELLGARLVNRCGGRIATTTNLDMDFFLQPEALRDLPAANTRAPLECLRVDDQEHVKTLEAVPVNIPGLLPDHLRAARDMAAASAAYLAISITSVHEAQTMTLETGGQFAVLHILNMGICALTALCAHAMRHSSRAGLLRDVRLLVCHAVLNAVERGQQRLLLSDLLHQACSQLCKVWNRGWQPECWTVARAACSDLGLDVLDDTVELHSLHQRRAAMEELRKQHGHDVGGEERVVFDSQSNPACS